ncbi:MAG: helix-turn-helix transcriptional regulator [Deltaproteobacteria bacterium]|nr:helix-turn-helix transcriptional regulator [Deltaproteobacteria bacterium]
MQIISSQLNLQARVLAHPQWSGQLREEVAPGQRVAQLRKERGLTQQELAERLGISQPVVSDYECGALRLHEGS